MTTTRDVLRFLGLTKARGPLPHWGLYATIAVCEVVVIAAGAAVGAPAWLFVLLGLLTVLMLAIAVVSYRQRRRARQDGDRGHGSWRSR
ncbi:hypothetical protein [Cellulomonas pakistanensis]|uniref:Uncharacterized protein n=1 Tax=Cellulomonas pakistanensis TaxID=992287 RepID=A0A919PBG6_9CELL|nr:hypothetical protein [Cellulomonas pakistanensis]GIG36500.1 hypothetical protein Cpa01nite_18810 [Cellulomonas pakistanensis]